MTPVLGAGRVPGEPRPASPPCPHDWESHQDVERLEAALAVRSRPGSRQRARQQDSQAGRQRDCLDSGAGSSQTDSGARESWANYQQQYHQQITRFSQIKQTVEQTEIQTDSLADSKTDSKTDSKADKSGESEATEASEAEPAQYYQATAVVSLSRPGSSFSRPSSRLQQAECPPSLPTQCRGQEARASQGSGGQARASHASLDSGSFSDEQNQATTFQQPAAGRYIKVS